MLAFGNRIVLVFSRLVELSPTATGKAQQRNAPDDVFAKDALCSELLAGAGVDILSGQHVLLLVAVPGRGGLMHPMAAEGGVASADANSEASTPTAAMVVACCAPAMPTRALRGHAGGNPPDPHLALHAPRSAQHLDPHADSSPHAFVRSPRAAGVRDGRGPPRRSASYLTDCQACS